MSWKQRNRSCARCVVRLNVLDTNVKIFNCVDLIERILERFHVHVHYNGASDDGRVSTALARCECDGIMV